MDSSLAMSSSIGTISYHIHMIMCDYLMHVCAHTYAIIEGKGGYSDGTCFIPWGLYLTIISMAEDVLLVELCSLM